MVFHLLLFRLVIQFHNFADLQQNDPSGVYQCGERAKYFDTDRGIWEESDGPQKLDVMETPWLI